MVRLWFDEKLTNQTHQPSSPTWLSTGFHGLDTCFSNYRLAAAIGRFSLFGITFKVFFQPRLSGICNSIYFPSCSVYLPSSAIA
jgi:hypothetical protein